MRTPGRIVRPPSRPSSRYGRGALDAARDDLVGEAVHRRGVQVVGAHELLDALRCARRREAEVGGDALLVLEGELVLVLPAEEVQRVAHAPEEVARRRDLGRARARVMHALLHQLVAGGGS